MKDNLLYYVHTDHLGIPRTITNNANNVVWQWNNVDPFGANLPTVDTIVYNKRFAGQYFDNESKLHYNYYRTYNPLLGRYVQSDPLGLAAGFNTYSYVGSNPLAAVDPLGLDAIDDFVNFSAALGDTALDLASFGLVSGSTLRAALGIEGVQECSPTYQNSSGVLLAASMFVPSGNKVQTARKLEFYTVYYETKIDKNIWKAKREIHFKEANQLLINDMLQNSTLKNYMKKEGINPATKTGKPIWKSPDGYTWHHDQKDGVMQLVKRQEHKKGGTHHNLMHPNGSGWFAQWGIK